MDCHVPPRVTFWTGVWDPRQEAISKEIATLRRMTGRSWVMACASHQANALEVRNRVVRLGGRAWPLLRAVARGVERAGDVTHVFGRLDEWHLLRATGRRPVVFTVVIDGVHPPTSLWDRVAAFVAETPALAASLRAAGAPPDRIRVIPPGVDLGVFTPAAPPAFPFRILFASSPSRVEEFEARGIPLLVATARQCPDIEMVLCWRAWGDTNAAARALEALSPPPNLRLVRPGPDGMPELFRSAHAVVCAYTPGFGKSAPNSILEGLACGRPALVTDGCALGEMIAGAGAGVVVRRSPEGLAAGIETLRASYGEFAAAARRLAETRFDEARFCAEYGALYEELRGSRRWALGARDSGPTAFGLGPPEPRGQGPEPFLR